MGRMMRKTRRRTETLLSWVFAIVIVGLFLLGAYVAVVMVISP